MRAPLQIGRPRRLDPRDAGLQEVRRFILPQSAVDCVAATVTLDVIVTTDIGIRDGRGQRCQCAIYQQAITVDVIVTKLAERSQEAAKEIAGSITPVPGGVGPMTITMLMKNTLRAMKMSAGI